MNIDKKIAFLFDLDGVLVDSETIYTRFWSHMDELYPTGIKNFARVIKGTTLTHIFDTYFPDKDVQREITALLDKQEREMKYEIKPGVMHLLQTLRQRQIPAVMVTSSNNVKMAQLWNQHPEFKEYFSFIVTADMVSHSKPDPQGYLIGASKAGASPENCVVFEDSRQGVMAGQAAGAYVVGVAGTLSADDLFTYCDIVLDSMEAIDIDNIIQKISRRT